MKRRLFKLVLFLLLGTIVNVAVAWGITLHSCSKQAVLSNAITGYHEQSPVSADDIRWLSRNGWKGTRDSDGIVHELRLVDYTACGVQHRDFVEVPHVVGHDMVITGMLSPFVIQTRAGWPTRSLSDERWRRWSGTRQWKHSYSARFPNLFGFFPPVENATVPLRPIWPGFAINTAFYAAILWIPFAPFVLRRHIRHKRGHCIKCGYDLRATSRGVCPECGADG